MFAILLAVAIAAAPSDSEMSDVVMSESAGELANGLAHCKGVWMSASGAYLASDMPANAKQMRERANGSYIAAAWLLSMRHNLQNPENQKTLSQFQIVVNGIADTTSTAVAAAIERGDNEQFGQMLQTCVDLLEVQQAFIDLMRSQAVSEQ